MGKVLFWLAVIFAALFVLRLINSRHAPRRGRKTASPQVESMVRCVRCGVYLPRSEAVESPAGSYRCHDARCKAP
jgi:uncharacterized protein